MSMLQSCNSVVNMRDINVTGPALYQYVILLQQLVKKCIVSNNCAIDKLDTKSGRIY